MHDPERPRWQVATRTRDGRLVSTSTFRWVDEAYAHCEGLKAELTRRGWIGQVGVERLD